jgi:hypothetical protein
LEADIPQEEPKMGNSRDLYPPKRARNGGFWMKGSGVSGCGVQGAQRLMELWVGWRLEKIEGGDGKEF